LAGFHPVVGFLRNLQNRIDVGSRFEGKFKELVGFLKEQGVEDID
jgi:hypothetical protein